MPDMYCEDYPLDPGHMAFNCPYYTISKAKSRKR